MPDRRPVIPSGIRQALMLRPWVGFIFLALVGGRVGWRAASVLT